jgi:transcriptional regulator with XRE-family HTH domain
MNEFAENLRNIRKSMGLTQDQLGERAGISAKHLGEIERGNASPSLEVVEKLAHGLRVDLLVLVGDDVSRLPRPQVRQEIVGALDHLDDDQLRALLRITRLTARR